MGAEGTTLHPAWTFLLRDVVGSVWGTVVFALVFVTPGYAVAQFTDVCSFRSRGLREQMAWSVALSFGVGTVVVVGLVWIFGIVTPGWILLAVGAWAVWMFSQSRPSVDVSQRERLLWATLAVIWVMLVVGSLVDIGIGDRLSMSVTSYDHAVRTAFVGAAMRTGVAPTNPLYWPGHTAPMRYFYFWYVLCGVVARLAHISARQALIASCVWPPAGVGAMVALYARYLLGWRGDSLRKGWWIAVALLSVTGLDLLANFGAQAGGDPLYGDMEWWSIDQVSSWADTFLWVPHHAAALVCCLLSMLLLWMCSNISSRGERFKLAVLAGISFAGAVGLSSYVALGAAAVLALWLVWRLLHADRGRVASALCVAALIAGLLLTPYLLQLLHAASGPADGTSKMLGFGVRRMLDPTMLANAAGFRTLRATLPFAETQLAALILLVPGYLVEFGFFTLVLCVATWRRGPRSAGERTLLFWTWSCLAAVSFVRSQVIANNDYAIRATLLAQFFLLLLATIELERSRGWLRRCLLGLALVGIAGTAYQLTVLRGFLPWHEAHGDPAMAQLAERNYALRSVYAAMDAAVPADARVQYDAASGGYFLTAQMLQANRQIVNADPGCASTFGGTRVPCAAMQQAVAELYNSTTTASEAMPLCRQIGAQYLVATRWDAVWNDGQSWVWTLPVVVGQPGARVLDCR